MTDSKSKIPYGFIHLPWSLRRPDEIPEWDTVFWTPFVKPDAS